jgi:hypothetical protein
MNRKLEAYQVFLVLLMQNFITFPGPLPMVLHEELLRAFRMLLTMALSRALPGALPRSFPMAPPMALPRA